MEFLNSFIPTIQYVLDGIIKNIIASDIVVAADIRIINLSFIFRDAELIKIFTGITIFGEWQIVASLAIIASVILSLWKKKTYLIPFWISIAGSELFIFFGKLAFHRSRPEIAFYTENTFSFPSGHSTIAVAFYGFLTYIMFRETKKWKHKINTVFCGIILIFAIGLSRLYLGVHFLSDVLGGYLLGAFWLVASIAISEWLRRRQPLILFVPTRKIKIAAAALIAAGIIFLLIFYFYYSPSPALLEKSDTIALILEKNS